MKRQQTLFPKPPKPDRTWVIGIGEQIWKAFEALSITKERHIFTPEGCKPLSREAMPRYYLGVFWGLIKNKRYKQ